MEEKDFKIISFKEIAERIEKEGKEILNKYFYDDFKKNSPRIELTSDEVYALAVYANSLQTDKDIITNVIKKYSFIPNGYEDYQAILGGASKVAYLTDDNLEHILRLLNITLEDNDED